MEKALKLNHSVYANLGTVTCREVQVDNDRFPNKFMVSLDVGVS